MALLILDFDFHWRVFAFYMLYVIISDQGCLGLTVNPTYLIECCGWTPVQLCHQGYFYVLYQYSIQPTRWNVANIDTAWGDIVHDA